MRTARALGGGRAWHWSPLCRRQQHRACTEALRCSPVRFLVAESGALSKLRESAAHITAAPCPAPLWVCSLLPTSLSAPPPSSLPPHPGTAAQQPAAMLQPGLGRTWLSLQALPSGLGPGAQGCVTAHKITRGSPRGSASAPAPNPVGQAASVPPGWAPGVVRAVIRRQQGLSRPRAHRAHPCAMPIPVRRARHGQQEPRGHSHIHAMRPPHPCPWHSHNSLRVCGDLMAAFGPEPPRSRCCRAREAFCRADVSKGSSVHKACPRPHRSCPTRPGEAGGRRSIGVTAEQTQHRRALASPS